MAFAYSVYERHMRITNQHGGDPVPAVLRGGESSRIIGAQKAGCG